MAFEFMPGLGVTPRVLWSTNVAASVTGTVSETQLASIPIPANLLGANGTLRVTTFWSHTNSANNKTLRVRFGGASGIQYFSNIVTTTASSMDMRHIHNNNAANAQKGFQSAASFGATATAVVTGSVNTAAATTIYVSAQLANSGETATLEAVIVEFIPAVTA